MNNTHQYDQIPLPSQLDEAIGRGLQKGIRRRRRHSKAFGTTLALLLVFLCANIEPLYAHAAELPIFGQMVRIMHIGSGGGAVSNVSLTSKVEEQGISLLFSGTEVPRYTSRMANGPRRMVLSVHGIAQADEATVLEQLRALPGVEIGRAHV